MCVRLTKLLRYICKLSENENHLLEVYFLPAGDFYLTSVSTPVSAFRSAAPFSFCSRRGSCLGSGGGGFRSAVLRARLRC